MLTTVFLLVLHFLSLLLAIGGASSDLVLAWLESTTRKPFFAATATQKKSCSVALKNALLLFYLGGI